MQDFKTFFSTFSTIYGSKSRRLYLFYLKKLTFLACANFNEENIKFLFWMTLF